MPARVGIVDDHPAVILGVTAMLEGSEDLRVVAAADSVPTLLETNRNLDVVLLDLVLDDASTPAENIRLLHDAQIPVLALTSGENPQLVREAGRAGVAGMIRKSENAQAITAAVRTVLRGGVAATPDWAAALDSDAGFVSAKLTTREAQVLALYASGETAQRVASELFISRETVLDHLKQIRAKYSAVDRPAHNKVELFRRALEDGVLSTEP